MTKNKLPFIYYSGRKTYDEHYVRSDLVYYRAYSAFTYDGGHDEELSIADLKNMKVGTLKKQYSNLFLEENGVEVMTYSSTLELLDALRSGEIEVAYTAIESTMRTAFDEDILSKLG